MAATTPDHRATGCAMTDRPPTACAAVRANFRAYLRRRLDKNGHQQVRVHLDKCELCWSSWNIFRWDAAAGSPLLADLRAFLGRRFRPYFDSSRALADEWAAAQPRTPADLRRFYCESEAYLYNLVVWHASGNRPDYIAAARPHLVTSRVVLDYGCGIGEDTLTLRDQGRIVVACDLPSPATDFLRWRLRRIRQPPQVLDPDQLDTAPRADTLWIIDTIDHLDDVDQWLGPTLAHVDTVICENLSQARGHGRQGFHYRRPRTELAAAFARYDLQHPRGEEDSAVSTFHRLARGQVLAYRMARSPLGTARENPATAAPPNPGMAHHTRHRTGWSGLTE